MAMPEATLDENYRRVFWEDYIRLSRKVGNMKPEAKPRRMKNPPHKNLWLRIL